MGIHRMNCGIKRKRPSHTSESLAMMHTFMSLRNCGRNFIESAEKVCSRDTVLQVKLIECGILIYDACIEESRDVIFHEDLTAEGTSGSIDWLTCFGEMLRVGDIAPSNGSTVPPAFVP